MSSKLIERMKVVPALAPSADIFAGDTATDVISLENYDRILFLLFGVATTGTAVVTVEECDDFTPTTSTAIAYTYYSNVATDVWSAAISATASGFTTATSDTYIYGIEVKASDLTEGFPCVRCVFTEGVDAAVIGSCTAILGDARFAGDPSTLPTAVA